MPDNALYYQLAYGATLLLYGGYALTILWRRRQLRRGQDRSRPPAP